MPDFTLSFNLQAPLQSWGVQSQFGHRETTKEPTKSGVIGLLAAALGRERHESIADLATLQMAVRVEQEGTVLRDFHTAGIDGFLRASGAVERKIPIVSNRFYLADAAFKVALQHTDRSFLSQLEKALHEPIFPLYLGRKSCVPIYLQKELKVVEMASLTLLQDDDAKMRKRIVADRGLASDAYWNSQNALFRTAPDAPISFQPRRFGLRETCLYYLKPQTPSVHVPN